MEQNFCWLLGTCEHGTAEVSMVFLQGWHPEAGKAPSISRHGFHPAVLQGVAKQCRECSRWIGFTCGPSLGREQVVRVWRVQPPCRAKGDGYLLGFYEQTSQGMSYGCHPTPH